MPRGARRDVWREWPRRVTVEIRNDVHERKIHFVLECSHVIEMGYHRTGWSPGVTDLRGGPNQRIGFACGHCQYGSPRGSVAPDKKRCEFFESYDRRQLWLPGVE